MLPLVEVLHAKGLGMGTVLAFMMAVVALSLPETILLRRVLKPKLIGAFVVVVAGDCSSGTCSTPCSRRSNDDADPRARLGMRQLPTLAENTREAAQQTGIAVTVEEVHDLAEIVSMGISAPPP